jgi:hypothetical protein
MFAPGHAYTATSRARRWEDIHIIDLCAEEFKVEYERLQAVHDSVVNRM